METVSSKEFVIDEREYFGAAVNSNNRVKINGQPSISIIPEQTVLEPDDDLRGAITMDELFDRVKENIRKKYANK